MTEGDALDDEIDRAWWKESVVYQIYPRSFNDSDGDGVGDIPGIVEKLDYLDDLGVDVVWLNPVYESPNADNGYDIADYRAIMDEFGTMDDWEELLEGLHERDIRLIMDLVVNHTSDEHEWFVKSRRGEEDYRDFYFWREGRTDVEGFTGHAGPEGEAPPNEWESFFGGPAWAYDEDVGEWYMHLFDEKQPDLNWENPDVREEVFDMMEWWLEKGIDGFRMDVINLISKPPEVTDHDPPTNTSEMWDSFDGPRVHEFLGEMGDRVLDDPDVFTVGEMIGEGMPMETARRYVGEDGPLSTLFHFDHVLLDQAGAIWQTEDWELDELRGVFTRWQEGLADDGWNSLYLSNHDQPRMVSRFGDDELYRPESAKLLATMLFTLRGTPYIYQGAEIGMTNYPFQSLEEFRDVETINPVQSAMDIGDIGSFEEVKHGLRANSRDNARTPMQWTDGENAGFTDGEPWINVNPNCEEINVEAARENPRSIWHYYRRLIELRKEHDVMVYGDYDLLSPDHEQIWAYARTLGDERLLVLLNFDGTNTEFELPEGEVEFDPERVDVDLLVSNYEEHAPAVAADLSGSAVAAGSDARAAGAAIDAVESEEAVAEGPGGTAESEAGIGEDITAFDLRPWEARVYRLTDPEA